MDGEQRYLDLIKNQPQIFERIPLYHIASYLGLERESLSRLRKKVAGK
jgi:CRP-like cAMP-binding protein